MWVNLCTMYNTIILTHRVVLASKLRVSLIHKHCLDRQEPPSSVGAAEVAVVIVPMATPFAFPRGATSHFTVFFAVVIVTQLRVYTTTAGRTFTSCGQRRRPWHACFWSRKTCFRLPRSRVLQSNTSWSFRSQTCLTRFAHLVVRGERPQR